MGDIGSHVPFPCFEVPKGEERKGIKEKRKIEKKGGGWSRKTRKKKGGKKTGKWREEEEGERHHHHHHHHHELATETKIESMRHHHHQFRLVDTTRNGGTIGYLPPESFQKRSMTTAKSDVFSFGIVVLEVVSGRRALDLTYPDDQIILLDWIRRLSDEEKLLQAEGHHVKPEWVVKRVTYEQNHGRAPPYLIYTDHDHHEIVLAIRGLNLIKESDYKLLLDNHLGMQMFDGGFAHHGLLKSATWFVEKWVSEGWHLFFFSF